ncbi:anti-sigma factor domain-containing protein [Clostridium sp. SHJSY1]|uniref:anti-sigma factor domain-containing protein n=1 Tax=Clostridium sp. SHJSY1 TaxID=2942483 RepID=UPI0028745BEF|nr:anti-sigma factor domain-containing protein [Clostridium sp. SHJSY1]MDS0528267.1 anti-sigma factor domain-containing protein [Clostridium sp. SHJSY1]
MGDFNRNKYIFSNESKVVDVGEKAIKLRGEQINLIEDELLLFKILIRDLVGRFPSYKERNLILNIAYYLVEDIELLEQVMKKRMLPFNRIAKMTKISRGFLERWQDYIIVYTIIFSNPDYKHIQDVLNVCVVNENGIVPLVEEEKINIYRGIILKAKKRSSVIITNSGEFVKIKKTEDVDVGQSVSGEEKKGLVHFKFYISLAVLLLMVLAFAAYKDYTHTTSTVVINSTSQVKLELNRLNRVINISSQTDRGKDMVQAVKGLDRKIDVVLRDCIEYASENKMVPNNGMLVTITGESLKYGELKETSNFVTDKKIQIQINNSGNLYNISKSSV